MDVEIETMTINDYDDVYALWKRTEELGLSDSDGRVPIARFMERNPDL